MSRSSRDTADRGRVDGTTTIRVSCHPQVNWNVSTVRQPTPVGGGSSTVVSGGSAPTQTRYEHNDAGAVATMVAEIDGTAARTWTYAYDDAVRAVQRDEPNNSTSAWTYDADDTLVKATLTANAPGPTPAELARWDYTYDELGRQDVGKYSGFEASDDGVTPGTQVINETHDFDYYPSGRLASLTIDGVAHNFTWDRNGNTRSGYVGGAHQSFTYNADDSTKTAGGSTYAYDSAGNTTDDGASCYAYDGFDRLTESKAKSGGSCGSNVTASYTYDAVDRQVSHTAGGTTTALHYDGLSAAVVEETASAARALVRDAGGEVRAVYTDAGVANPVQFLHTDGQSNVTAVTGTAPTSTTPGLALLCPVPLRSSRVGHRPARATTRVGPDPPSPTTSTAASAETLRPATTSSARGPTARPGRTSSPRTAIGRRRPAPSWRFPLTR